MKIAVNRNLDSKATGPLLFSNRLLEYLTVHYGIQVVSPNQKPDIYFAVISFSKSQVPKGSKAILRVDGIYWNMHDKNRKMNAHIFESIRLADGVVYQSHFCRRCCETRGVRAKRFKVILNGVDTGMISVTPKYPLPHYPGLVACAKWRPTKRPHSTCRGFLASSIPHHLYILGKKPKDGVTDSRITWMGTLSPADSIGVMKSCSHAIHLGKFDPCPNAVVEEICCGLPVLHTAHGGTPEIVLDQGIKMPVDVGWDYRDLKVKIDNIDPKLISTHLSELVKMGPAQPRRQLTMEYVAKKYYRFFEGVLR